MHRPYPWEFRILAVSILALLLGSPVISVAQDHIVSSRELRQAAVDAAGQRATNLAKVQRFFSSPPVQKTLKSAHLDPVRVEKAVPTLNDQELERLAARTGKINQQFAAGSLTNEQLTYAAIALGAAVIVLIAVR